MVLKGEERDVGRPHGRLHVHPGGVGPLGNGIVSLVEDLVEDLQTLVGQADLVGVGIDEQPRDRSVGVLGDLGSQFSTDIAGRLGDLGQEGLHTGPEGLHLPQHLRAATNRAWPNGLFDRASDHSSMVKMGGSDPEVAMAAVLFGFRRLGLRLGFGCSGGSNFHLPGPPESTNF